MIDILCSATLYNWRITIRELSDKLGLSFGLVQSILTVDSGMKHISAKFIPELLTVKSHLVQNFLAKHQIPLVPQSPLFTGHGPM
jgi:hypothetical protein